MRASHAISIFVCSAIFLISGRVSSQTTIAGATPGGFQVSETGAAVYSIPIQVPSGIAGLAPKLALVYSSQAGNGIAGVGWNIAGLSAIQRCPLSPVQDNKRRGVQYDSRDRYCLDGQRLVAVSGTYGADGTEYRTERESFSRVISYGVAGSGPAWFKVWTKAGLVMEFGNTADSRIEAKQGQAHVRVFALNKVSDLSTNYWTVIYNEDTVNGEFYATRIDYTGNSTRALSPSASVRFSYAARPDPVYTNVGGAPVRMSVRITNVQTYFGNAMVKDYRLAYQQATGTSRSRLTSVTECSGDGTQCFSPTSFSWQEPVLGVQNLTWSGEGQGNAGWLIADLFGDGRQVYWTQNSDGSHYGTRRNQDGSVQNWYWPVGYNAQWTFGDLFGEGRQLYYTYAGNANHYAFHLNADGTVQEFGWSGAPGIGDSGKFEFADLFGDGRMVLWSYNLDGTHFATRFNPDGTFQTWSWPGLGYNNTAARADLFGDGRQLYWTYANGTHTAYRFNSDNTVETFTWTGGYGPNTGGWRLVDLFGDGRQLFYTNDANGNHYATRLNPDGTIQNFQWTGGTVNPRITTCGGICITGTPWVTGDVFGDGRQVWYSHGADGMHYATRLYADNTLQNWSWSGGNGGGGNSTWPMPDTFGTGRQLFYIPSGTTHSTTSVVSSKPDVLLSVTNSLGQTATFSYLPLTDSTVYSKSSGAAYPAQDVQIPIYVVSAMAADNGIGSTNAANYFYTGARSYATGSGFLGFSQFRATDAQTLIKAETGFRQDYPFQGLTLSVTKTAPGSIVLTGTTNTWTDAQYQADVGGNHHRSDLTQWVQTNRDLNGAALPTLTATTSYDTYGNALTVTTTTGDGYSKTTTNTYADIVNSTQWLLGRLKRASVASTIP